MQTKVRKLVRMLEIAALIRVIDSYMSATGLAEATVSARFLGRGGRVRELRAGGDIGARKLATVLEAFSATWPANAVWPADVPRPASDSEAAA